MGAFPRFRASSIWRAHTEPKCQFFAWLALFGKAPITYSRKNGSTILRVRYAFVRSSQATTCYRNAISLKPFGTELLKSFSCIRCKSHSRRDLFLTGSSCSARFPPSSSRELTLGLSSSFGGSYGRREIVVSLNRKNVLPCRLSSRSKKQYSPIAMLIFFSKGAHPCYPF
jgi:hypothetical protein